MKEALVFSVEGEMLAVSLGLVSEVLRAAWPLRLPRAPYGCLGMLDVRGQLIPFLDLAVLLGLRPPMRTEKMARRLLNAHVLRIDSGAVELGLLVDRVNEVSDETEELTPADRSAAVALGRAGEMVKGVALVRRAVNAESVLQRVLILDLSNVISAGRLKLLRRHVGPPTAPEP